MEERIKQLMKTLEITREEAIDLIREDEEVDRMTVKEAEADLTAEQKKAIKKLKGGARAEPKDAVNAYGRKVKVNRKPDDDKRELIKALVETLTNIPEIDNINVENVQKQIDFKMNDRNFRIVLSAPTGARKKK